jgi:hypothetical protein
MDNQHVSDPDESMKLQMETTPMFSSYRVSRNRAQTARVFRSSGELIGAFDPNLAGLA